MFFLCFGIKEMWHEARIINGITTSCEHFLLFLIAIRFTLSVINKTYALFYNFLKVIEVLLNTTTKHDL